MARSSFRAGSERYGRLSRRDWLRLSSAGFVGSSLSGWIEALANHPDTPAQRKRSCILLWMNGGPSQTDTFDLKPGHANGGPYKEIATSVPGIRVSEHLPKIAKHMHRMAPVRSMSTKEGDHGRATYLLRTGYLPVGSIQYPGIGSLIAKELGDTQAELPNVVSVAPFRVFNPAAYGAGFLGPQYAPLVVGEGGGAGLSQRERNEFEKVLKVQDAERPWNVTREQADARLGILEKMQQDFLADHPGVPTRSHRMAYERAVRLMRSAAARAFHLEEEPIALREAYGMNLFGQGCLLSRRLVERGVPFIEVTLGSVDGNGPGWDTHQDNFTAVQRLSQVLDAGWATLMEDLQARGLLDSTLIVWMGEFGRTPKINDNKGRDHFPNAWSTVLAGGGIKGGAVVGKTSPDGMTVAERPVSVPDLLATVCKAVGIDPMKQNMSNVGRPIRIADKSAQPIQEIVA
jgi:hypothetical protein